MAPHLHCTYASLYFATEVECQGKLEFIVLDGQLCCGLLLGARVLRLYIATQKLTRFFSEVIGCLGCSKELLLR